MNYVYFKDGVKLEAVTGTYIGRIAPAGVAILAALWATAQELGHDITVTSGADGCHSGELDPHHSAEAYDCRTHDMPDKKLFLATLKKNLPDYDNRFFAWIENEGLDNEHLHVQRKKNTVYPPIPNNHESVQDAITG